MGDDDKSFGSRFLSKSKWGKVFKENDAPTPSAGPQNTFKLNDDVVDFLKPSTDKASSTRQNLAPKIDVAIAQRWPGAHEMRRASGPQTPQPAIGGKKARRRKDLSVSFARAAPEIIGEGGDDALDPPSEIGRRNHVRMRSVSDKRPSSLDNGAPWPGTQPPRADPRRARPPSGPEDDFRPQPVRRVQTSHNEMSPPIQRKHATPPIDPLQHRPTLSRTPTGFDSQDESSWKPMHEYDDTHAQSHPQIDTSIANHNTNKLSSMPQSPQSPAIAKQRTMQASEGMALRRASAMFMNEPEAATAKDPNTGVQPPQRFYNSLAEPLTASSVASSEFEPRLPPGSAVSPDGPSPFADPKYVNTHTDGTPSTSASTYSGSPLSLRQPRKSETPSYMPHKASQEMPLRKGRDAGQPSYMRAAAQSQEASQQNHTQAYHPPSEAVGPQSAGAPAQSMQVPRDQSRDRSRSPMRDRLFDPPAKPKTFYSQPDHSSGSINRFPVSPKFGHGRSDSRDSSPIITEGNNPSGHSQPSSISSASRRHQQSGMLGSTSPDYFAVPRAASAQPARSPAANLRNEEAPRPSSSGSSPSANRHAPSLLPPCQSDPAADNALADFAARVAHMKGVFRLTAEKERPADRCSTQDWLRAAVWWYLKGKAGLESVLQRRPKQSDGQREVLMQPHVDLAKTWWILSDVLDMSEGHDSSSPQSPPSTSQGHSTLRRSVFVLQSRLKSLNLAMARDHLMPPHQSLIQGQDTRVWLDYPHFTADAAAVLSGDTSRSVVADNAAQRKDALDLMPLGDTEEVFCFGRFAADVSLNTDEAETDRVVLPCLLTMTRSRRDYQPTIVLASQSELVSIRVGPKQPQSKSLTWGDVSWKASSQGMVVHLQRGFDLTVRMQERDFRSLWNLFEYSRKVQHSFRVERGEKLVHEARLAELQYADSSNGNVFPTEKMRDCLALVFERTAEHNDGSGTRKLQRGYRLLLVTGSTHKSLSTVSHEICRRTPLCFEFITDAAANGTTAMIVRVREDNNRQIRILLVFPDTAGRQALYDVINGITITPEETIVGKMNITGLDVKPAFSGTSPGTSVAQQALRSLQWQKLGITNLHPEDVNSRIPDTVESESLRIVARHGGGCITDRLNLGKGELLFRLPCSEVLAVEMLRQPQEDLTMAIDSRNLAQTVTDGLSELLRTIQQRPTIRTFTFASTADLHAFQASITGFKVKYDGIASTLAISRRMMVVPIHYKQQATNIRIQVVAKGQVVQFLASMDDFQQASALCFQVKSTDTFERVKGDGKGKKWAIKMVDAKFSLPNVEKGEPDPEEAIRRRFVNLEGLEYASEHCDITIGFDTEEGKLQRRLQCREYSC